MPQAVIEHFSQRRAQILEHIAEHGGRSAVSAQIAALETRRAMQDVPIDRLRADWTAHAAEHGLTLDVVEDLLGHGSTREARVPAAARGPDRPRQHLGCAGLLRVLAKGQPTGARVAELEALAARTLADREIVKLPDAPAQAGVVEARYSTRDLLETEATDSPTRSPSSRRHRALASRATG